MGTTAVVVAIAGCRTPPPVELPEIPLHADASTRLLVLAPHPDDESLAAAGLMQRVRASGGSVHVVVMTSGDAFPEGVSVAMHKPNPQPVDYRHYAETRERETLAALQRQGLSRADVRFLGFPDGGLCMIASKYLSAKSRAFESPYTRRRQPPASDHVIRGVAYRGADIRRELESILAAYRPTIAVAPSGEDDHPDHCATAIFAHEALDAAAAGRNVRVIQYLIHHDGWPNEDEPTTTTLQPPRGFPTNAGEWRTLPLTSDEAAVKRRVIMEAYATQMLVIGRFLQTFARPNELFLEGRGKAAPECWCDDRHVATETRLGRYRRRPRPRR